MNYPTENQAQDARQAAEHVYADAQRRQAATPTRALAADHGRYQQRLVSALARTRDSMLTGQQRDQAWHAVKAVADQARETFAKWCEMPADTVVEIWARENGRMSPKAMKASMVAVTTEQHRKDSFMRDAAEIVAKPEWSVLGFLQSLAERGVFIVPDDGRRIIGRLAGQVNAVGPDMPDTRRLVR